MMNELKASGNTWASNLGYLALPRTISHGCQIVHWDPGMRNEGVLKKHFSMGYVKMHGFYGNP